MESLDTVEKTNAVFARLRERARMRSPELREEWFEATLFKTRTLHVEDYLAEAERNARTLARTPESAPTYDFIREVVEAQLMALVQALYRDEPR
ncbi:primosomal replication protein PriC [Aliidiomarina sanyensis]|uniref:Uncharacterized protein n=1 Tax=Aliidiomarina sanyensis TaxID=1249555 RepID=A0A432WNJ0_9GAMM|nr:primosomal replication protein PriC [Aliidiomarina sanyensis]RUO35370.1 hypothetical protein CWE11_04980 [Aliidiomarina sanyensis]